MLVWYFTGNTAAFWQPNSQSIGPSAIAYCKLMSSAYATKRQGNHLYLWLKKRAIFPMRVASMLNRRHAVPDGRVSLTTCSAQWCSRIWSLLTTCIGRKIANAFLHNPEGGFDAYWSKKMHACRLAAAWNTINACPTPALVASYSASRRSASLLVSISPAYWATNWPWTMFWLAITDMPCVYMYTGSSCW